MGIQIDHEIALDFRISWEKEADGEHEKITVTKTAIMVKHLGAVHTSIEIQIEHEIALKARISLKKETTDENNEVGIVETAMMALHIRGIHGAKLRWGEGRLETVKGKLTLISHGGLGMSGMSNQGGILCTCEMSLRRKIVACHSIESNPSQ